MKSKQKVTLTKEEIDLVIKEFAKHPEPSKETIRRAEQLHRVASRISVEDMFKPFNI